MEIFADKAKVQAGLLQSEWEPWSELYVMKEKANKQPPTVFLPFMAYSGCTISVRVKPDSDQDQK